MTRRVMRSRVVTMTWMASQTSQEAAMAPVLRKEAPRRRPPPCCKWTRFLVVNPGLMTPASGVQKRQKPRALKSWDHWPRVSTRGTPPRPYPPSSSLGSPPAEEVVKQGRGARRALPPDLAPRSRHTVPQPRLRMQNGRRRASKGAPTLSHHWAAHTIVRMGQYGGTPPAWDPPRLIGGIAPLSFAHTSSILVRPEGADSHAKGGSLPQGSGAALRD
jgi:hypothetical protein